MTIEEFITVLRDIGEPQAKVLVSDANGLAWALDPDDLKIEDFEGEINVVIDSPNVRRP